MQLFPFIAGFPMLEAKVFIYVDKKFKFLVYSFAFDALKILFLLRQSDIF
jgi:hypothetical protein